MTYCLVSGTIGLLIVVLTLASLTSVFAFSTPQFSMAPRIQAGAGENSPNWSGYAVTGPIGWVTGVAGSWVVPTVTASTTDTYSSFWVGIDGYSSPTVEQIGTDSNWVNGTAQYYAWYEFYPEPPIVIPMTVNPGDVILAQVGCSGNYFSVLIVDMSNSQPYFHAEKTVPSALRSSAEWIAEAPSSQNGTVLPLANFGTVYFGSDYTSVSDTCYARVGDSMVLHPIGYFGSAVHEITMTDPSGSLIKAQPSSLTPDGSSFSVQRISHATVMAFSLSPNPAVAGQTVVLLGNLKDELGQPLTNTKVSVYVNGSFATNLYTNASGWFRASAPVTSLGTFTVSVTYAGSDTHNPSWHAETLTVYQKTPTSVTFTLSPNPVKVGQTINLKGHLADVKNNPIANAPLELWVKIGAGAWQYVTALSTDGNGGFQASGKVMSADTYQVAVVYRGTSQYNMSYKIETLTVNP